MAYIVAGPIVALIGVAAVFFVLRRKSVEKRSMYSARRSQIEHKVRAARQRTLTPHGHVEKAPEPEPGAASPFSPTQVQPTITYQPSAYEAPPAAPPPAAPTAWPQRPAEPLPWEQGPTTAPPAPGAPEYPSAQPEPVEPFRPAAEPTPMPSSEPVWTPAPAEPMPPAAPVAPAASATASATAAGAWSVVSSEKESSAEEAGSKKKKKQDKGLPTGSWQLASGDSPGMDADEPEAKRSNAKLVAVAQYAIFVVGLVMVLIGIVVMVANSHVT